MSTTRSSRPDVTDASDPGGAFGGTVETTAQQTLCIVRGEVHLSSGVELGLPERTDLAAGDPVAVHLASE